MELRCIASHVLEEHELLEICILNKELKQCGEPCKVRKMIETLTDTIAELESDLKELNNER